MMLSAHPEVLLSSAVLVGDSGGFPSLNQVQIEEALGSSVEVPQGLIISEGGGSGTVFQLTKYRIEVVLTRRKLEFNAKGETPREEIFRQLARTVRVVTGFATSPSWELIGYNFNVVVEAPNSKRAIEQIASRTIDVEEINRRLDVTLRGAATWLYFDDIDGWRLWLRLEPRGGDRQTKRIWVYANFDQPVTGLDQLEENRVVQVLAELYDRFLAILRKL